ncbi:MAG: hypothetical protein GEU93_13825 [Propionibacteriales bacterium]|nr:hypothetical protein [Propionibacteriales bacterium]
MKPAPSRVPLSRRTSVITGYDPNDPPTAYAVGNVADDDTADLDPDDLRGKRLGIIRRPMSGDAGTSTLRTTSPRDRMTRRDGGGTRRTRECEIIARLI